MTTLVLFTAYLVATIAIGVWAARRNAANQEDYFLAGRGVSAFAMALSAVSSGRSAWLVLGATGLAWLEGWSAIWLFPGYILAEALMFVTLGPRLRARSIEVGALTVPEVLARAPRGPRGAGSSRLPVRALGGLVIVAFLLTYVSAQLVAGAKTLDTLFEVDGKTWGLVITAGIVLGYTWLGGYRAVVVTDVIQALLMLVGLLLLPILGLVELGGFAGMQSALEAIDPALLDFHAGGFAIAGGFCIGLGSLGNPHILVRHMSLDSRAEARYALGYGTSWNVIMATGALFLGLVGRALFPELADLGDGGREVLYPVLARELSGEYLFTGFVGFLLATLFAAIMSTCDSQLLVIAASVMRDLLPGRDTGGLLASRLAVLGTLVAAVWLTFGESHLVNNLVLLSWFALGVGFGPAILMLVYDRRTTARGVFAGVLTGVFGIVGVWFVFLRPVQEHVSWQGGPVFLAALLVTWVLRDWSGGESD